MTRGKYSSISQDPTLLGQKCGGKTYLQQYKSNKLERNICGGIGQEMIQAGGGGGETGQEEKYIPEFVARM